MLLTVAHCHLQKLCHFRNKRTVAVCCTVIPLSLRELESAKVRQNLIPVSIDKHEAELASDDALYIS